MAVRDVVMIGVLLFVFGMGFFVINFMMDLTVTEMIAVPEINSTNATVTALEGILIVTSRLDYLVFGLFIGLVLALIISSWFISGNPLFMFIYFIVWVIGVVMATVLANTWETMTNLVIFGTTLTQFPITNNLLLYLPIYISVIGFIGFTVMFAKPYMQQ